MISKYDIRVHCIEEHQVFWFCYRHSAVISSISLFFQDATVNRLTSSSSYRIQYWKLCGNTILPGLFTNPWTVFYFNYRWVSMSSPGIELLSFSFCLCKEKTNQFFSSFSEFFEENICKLSCRIAVWIVLFYSWFPELLLLSLWGYATYSGYICCSNFLEVIVFCRITTRLSNNRWI